MEMESLWVANIIPSADWWGTTIYKYSAFHLLQSEVIRSFEWSDETLIVALLQRLVDDTISSNHPDSVGHWRYA